MGFGGLRLGAWGFGGLGFGDRRFGGFGGLGFGNGLGFKVLEFKVFKSLRIYGVFIECSEQLLAVGQHKHYETAHLYMSQLWRRGVEGVRYHMVLV